MGSGLVMKPPSSQAITDHNVNVKYPRIRVTDRLFEAIWSNLGRSGIISWRQRERKLLMILNYNLRYKKILLCFWI